MEHLAPDFWTIRGTFRIAGVLDVGTQMSVVRRADGRFVLLDSFAAPEEELAAIARLTDAGRLIEAIINVHPFHTLHCEAVHRRFPDAELIGTERHLRQLPALPWSEALIEQPATQQRFAAEFDFSVPNGLDFVSRDDSVHAASVLVRHRPSRIVHVDDTLNVFVPPRGLRRLLPPPRLRFHPRLGRALERRAGAADAFELWAGALAQAWADTGIVCAAHSAIHRPGSGGFRGEVEAALAAAQPVLDKHRQKFS